MTRHTTLSRSAEALLDDLGARDTLVGLLDNCMNAGEIVDEDNTHPFTVFYVFKVPVSRMLQFEAWVQQTIVAQSQKFLGYKGTLIYRPDNQEDLKDVDTVQYLLDCRYRGSKNLKLWLMSKERDLMYSQAKNRNLWVPEATTLRVVDGNFGSVDNLWQDARTQIAHKETTFAKWRLVTFKCLCVWIAVLVCGWPGCSLASSLRSAGLNKFCAHTVVVTVAVAVVVYVCIPLFQPFIAHLLVKKSEAHPDSSKSEMQLLTMTETMEEHRVAAMEDASKLLQAVEDDTLGLVPMADGIVTVVLNHHVKPGRFDAFEDACRDLADAAEQFNACGFVGHTLVRPAQDSNIYTLIFRYQNKEALEKWLTSDEQSRFAARLYKLVQSPAEVQVHNYSAVDLLLHGFDSNAKGRQPPPPKWKTFCLIAVSLYPWSLISAYVWAPLLASWGVVYPAIALCTSFFNCGSHSYTTTPILSRILSTWLSKQTPIPSWANPEHPLVRWPIQGFNQQELNCLFCGYWAWVLGRWRPSATIFV